MIRTEVGTTTTLLLVIALFGGIPLDSRAAELPVGSGSFEFVDPEGNPDRPITVHFHRPQRFRTDDAVVFVIHGLNRNAKDYHEVWRSHADSRGFLLLCPEFSDKHYPNSRRFNLGFMVDDDGQPRDKKKWSFFAIERIFDRVVEENRLEAEQYSIYGHSAGGQFVHRFVLFLPDARYKLAIAANPGWYTMPTSDAKYPYGLGGTGVDKDQLRDVFGRRFVLLLGTADTDAEDKNLRTTAEALDQGPHRLARGKNYFKESKERAKSLDADFRWRMQTVRGVGHSNKRMAPAAAKMIR